MARRFSVALRQLNRKGRHSATGLMACKKGQHGFEPMLAFFVAEIFKARRSIPTDILLSLLTANRGGAERQ